MPLLNRTTILHQALSWRHEAAWAMAGSCQVQHTIRSKDKRCIGEPSWLYDAALPAVPSCTAALPVLPQIRDSIKSLFPDRDCYTLVRPMHDERALNHLDTLDNSQLRPEFSQVHTYAC